jgi:hypothetical protein
MRREVWRWYSAKTGKTRACNLSVDLLHVAGQAATWRNLEVSHRWSLRAVARS